MKTVSLVIRFLSMLLGPLNCNKTGTLTRYSSPIYKIRQVSFSKFKLNYLTPMIKFLTNNETRKQQQLEKSDEFFLYIENNTWLRGNTIFISSVDIISKGIINKAFPSIHVFLCLLYKGKSF